MDHAGDPKQGAARPFTSAELGLIGHLYRAEIYRSTTWRSRLDTTTNWAVVTLGIALSITFSAPDASPVPLVVVGFLLLFFLLLEARRYRYYNIWRARARWMEMHLLAPMLEHGAEGIPGQWQATLANDYRTPAYHISFRRAVGRRLRRNYIWLLLIQTLAWFAKIVVQPTAVTSLEQFFGRAAIGPIPGELVVLGAVAINALFLAAALATIALDRRKHRRRAGSQAIA